MNDAQHTQQILHQRIEALYPGLSPEARALVTDLSNHATQLSHQIADLQRCLADLQSGIYTSAPQLNNGETSSILHTQSINTTSQEPASKRRRLDGDAIAFNTANGSGPDPLQTSRTSSSKPAWITKTPVFTAPDVSVVLPVRKKFKLSVVAADGAGASGAGSTKARGGGGLVFEAVAGKEGESMAFSWRDIDQIISVPVPEASKPAYYFVIIPSPPSMRIKTSQDPTLNEPLIFSTPSAKPKDSAATDDATQEAMYIRLFNAQLSLHGRKVTVPESSEFESKLVQAHRKGEKSWHVKAFRGSKEGPQLIRGLFLGFIYLLRTGILFGFRKPLLYFPLHSITSISYSSILQRTFNLNVSARLSSSDSTCFIPHSSATGLQNLESYSEESDFEFSMLDQADYEGLNAYVRGHGLHDASLAEGRRATYYNVNKARGEAASQTGATALPGSVNNGEDEESELQKAERELQDREDEEEEDYDPSGGESEGSGSDSEEEEEEGGGRDEKEGEEGEEEDFDEEDA